MNITPLTTAKCANENCQKEFLTAAPTDIRCCPYCGWDTLEATGKAAAVTDQELRKAEAKESRNIEDMESSPGTRNSADHARGRKYLISNMRQSLNT